MGPVSFRKYQGTGNDFILVDDREHLFPDDVSVVRSLCDRKFGIGSDGLMLIRRHESADFTLVFYNPDGSQSLCGNGSRCAVIFARDLGIISDSCRFLAYDGMHDATILADGRVRLHMQDVQDVRVLEDGILLDTGSPHLITYVDSVENTDVVAEGRKIRYNETFATEGVNVNFVSKTGRNSLRIRTYERGVENETLSCGTGVTAAALASADGMESPVTVQAAGGELQVEFRQDSDRRFTDVFLIGPAKYVFSGQVELGIGLKR